jgi:hypothetical protein
VKGFSEDVLSFSDSSSSSRSAPTLVPLSIKILITFFYFVYAGSETGYAGWISTFALLENVTADDSKAAYLSAYFWAALTVGRLLAIPSAIVFTATAMLRFQIALSLTSGILVVMFAHTSYMNACLVSSLLGFALSSVYPLVMTIVADYGYSM